MNFASESHTYERNGLIYTPVSDFLAKFKPEFPKGMLAQKVGQKDGRTMEEVIEQWDLNAEMSIHYGNAVHAAVQYWLKFGLTSKVAHLKLAAEKFAEKYDRAGIESEIVAFNDPHLIAGTIDQIHRISPGKVKLTDVKTNGELTDEARGKFLAPLDKLPFSKLNEYRLQLSVYKWLLEQKSISVESIELEHWNGEEYETIPLEPINVAILFDQNAFDPALTKKTITV